MPSHRNPLQKVVGEAKTVAEKVKVNARQAKHRASGSKGQRWADFDNKLGAAGSSSNSTTCARTSTPPGQPSYVDITIHFIGANGLPKMDVVGTADPYFVAKLSNSLKFVSTVKPNTLSPVWNEYWQVRNVPSNAVLSVDVLDKDEGPTDDYIGTATTGVEAGTRELSLEGKTVRRERGSIWIKIDSHPSATQRPKHILVFDGPIRYSRHFSPTVGRLTNLDDARLYSTWKMFLRGVPLFFGDTTQHWNVNYKAAQTIFQGNPLVRRSIQAGHHMLYARTTRNGFGIIEGPQDIIRILHGGTSPNTNITTTIDTTQTSLTSNVPSSSSPFRHQVKPAVYTYIISATDHSFRFSETGAAFFVDFASKHALHSNCAESVVYSGEFHPRPAGGWQNFSSSPGDGEDDKQTKWEFVIDNNSGTYAPDPMMLPCLQELLEYNFPWFKVVTYDYNDPRLKESREACRNYALAKRGVSRDELQPHVRSGEVTLSGTAAVAPTAVAKTVMRY